MAKCHARNVAMAHGVFMTASGIWPIVAIDSFQKVTGPKVDTWLVKTVGALLTVVGTRMIADARADDVRGPTAWLGIGVAGMLGFISCFYALKQRISRVYLLDTAVEAAWIAVWIRALARQRRYVRSRV